MDRVSGVQDLVVYWLERSRGCDWALGEQHHPCHFPSRSVAVRESCYPVTRDEQLNWKLVGILIRQADHSLSTPIHSICVKSDQQRQGRVRCSPSRICWRPRQWAGKRSVVGGSCQVPQAPLIHRTFSI